MCSAKSLTSRRAGLPNYCRGIGSNQICKRPPDRPVCSRRGTRRGLTGWEHTITIERLADPEPGVLYPRLIEVSGRCPPEDCGGPWGYADLLEAIKDPKHKRHAELTEWIGDDFDPDDEAEALTARSPRSRKRGRVPPSKSALEVNNPRP